MSASPPPALPRILIVDDNPSVHEAFDRILRAEKPDQVLEDEEAFLFNDSREADSAAAEYEIDHAMSGPEAIEKARQALAAERPYQVGFVDIRMPGMDGVKTIDHLWEIDAKIQTVICTAYADYRWRDLTQRFGRTDRLLVLKKPFHDIEVLQLTSTLTQKWTLARQAALRMDQMERIVAQRTQKVLALQRFEHQQLRDLDQAKLRSVLKLAQEFRNPLTLILNPIEDMMKGIPLDRQRQELIQRNARGLLELLEHALLVRRLETENRHLDSKELDAASFVRGLVESCVPWARKRGVILSFSADPPQLFIRTDPAKLEKALSSILAWAMESAADKSRVTARMHAHEGGAKIEFAISESPRGEEGMALLLARETLRHLEGGLVFEAGTGRMTVTLPASNPPTLPAGEEKAAPPAEDAPEDRELPLLLLVEENADLRAFIREGLGAEYRFGEAIRGEEALAHGREHVPDLIIIDFDRSRNDAIELCGQFKNDHVTSHIPIVLLGADISESAQLGALEAGVDDCVAKPFRLPLLKARVNNLVENRRKWRQRAHELTAIQPREMASSQMDAEFLRRVVEKVETNLSDYEFDVEALAHQLGMSRRQLFRKFKAVAGCTPNVLIREIRLKHAAKLLLESNLTVSEIIYAVGFSDPKHFRAVFKERFGLLPGEYAKKPLA